MQQHRLGIRAGQRVRITLLQDRQRACRRGREEWDLAGTVFEGVVDDLDGAGFFDLLIGEDTISFTRDDLAIEIEPVG